MGFQMIFSFNVGYADGLIRGVMPVSRIVRMKSGQSGQLPKPLSPMTIQEKGFLGNRISLRRTLLFSGSGGSALLLKCAVIISSVVLCSARA